MKSLKIVVIVLTILISISYISVAGEKTQKMKNVSRNVYQNFEPFQSPDFFLGTMCSGVLNKKTLISFIRRIKPGKYYEVGLHPGLKAQYTGAYPQKNYNRFIASARREDELNLLMDEEIQHILKTRSVRLVSYREL